MIRVTIKTQTEFKVILQQLVLAFDARGDIVLDLNLYWRSNRTILSSDWYGSQQRASKLNDTIYGRGISRNFANRKVAGQIELGLSESVNIDPIVRFIELDSEVCSVRISDFHLGASLQSSNKLHV